MQRYVACSDQQVVVPRLHLAHQTVSFKCLNNLRLDVPVTASFFTALSSLLAEFEIAASSSSRSTNKSDRRVSASHCSLCFSLPKPVLFPDDLRRLAVGLVSTPDWCSSEAARGLPAVSLFSAALPYWPWVREPQADDQLQCPLLPHPWPRYNEVVFCDNLYHTCHYSSVGQSRFLLEEDCRQPVRTNHWVGLTWAYPQSRTPTALRILPVTFDCIECFSNDVSKNDLQLSCLLQRWDPLEQQNGSFVTVASFWLTQGDVTERHLNDRPPSQSDLPSTVSKWDRLRSILDGRLSRLGASTDNQSPERSASLADTSYHDFSRVSSANIWRLLVDLRARRPSSSVDTIIIGSEGTAKSNKSSDPVALAYVSPLALAGCVCLDTVWSPEAERSSLHCLLPMTTVSLLDQNDHLATAADGVCVHDGGAELARLEMADLALTVQQTSFGAPSPVLLGGFSLFRLSTADPHWARMQRALFVGRLRYCTERLGGSELGLPFPHGSVFVKRVHLVSSVERVIALKYLISVLGRIGCSQGALPLQCPPIGGSSGSPTCDLDLPPFWSIVNHSDWMVHMQQLPVYVVEDQESHSCVSQTLSFHCFEELFEIRVSPGGRKPWRPIVLPGTRIKCKQAMSTVRLRFGVSPSGGPNNSQVTEEILWGHPVEITWPPLAPGLTHRGIASAMRLIWTSATNENNHPNLCLFPCLKPPIGRPGMLILHSDCIFRNLLPLDVVLQLHSGLMPSGTGQPVDFDSVDHLLHRQYELTQSRNTRYVSTLVPPPCSLHQETSLVVRFGLSPGDRAVVWWSPPVTLSPPAPFSSAASSSSANQVTSWRQLIPLHFGADDNQVSPGGVFYAVLTVELRSVGPMAPRIKIVTLSPMFEVHNMMLSELKVKARPFHCYPSVSYGPVHQTTEPQSSGTPWTCGIPSAPHYLLEDDSERCWTVEESQLPRCIASPIEIARADHLLLEAYLTNGKCMFAEPLQLAPDSLLSKLASACLNSISTNSSSSDKDRQAKNSKVCLSVGESNTTLACLLEPCVPPYAVDKSTLVDRLLYTFRVVIRPKVTLVNRSGLQLLIRSASSIDRLTGQQVSAENLESGAIYIPPAVSLFSQLGVAATDGSYHWFDACLSLARLIPNCADQSGYGAKDKAVNPIRVVDFLSPGDQQHQLLLRLGHHVVWLCVKSLPLASDTVAMGNGTNDSLLILISACVNVDCRLEPTILIRPIMLPSIDARCQDSPVSFQKVSWSALPEDTVTAQRRAYTPLPQWTLIHSELVAESGSCCRLFPLITLSSVSEGCQTVWSQPVYLPGPTGLESTDSQPTSLQHTALATEKKLIQVAARLVSDCQGVFHLQLDEFNSINSISPFVVHLVNQSHTLDLETDILERNSASSFPHRLFHEYFDVFSQLPRGQQTVYLPKSHLDRLSRVEDSVSGMHSVTTLPYLTTDHLPALSLRLRNHSEWARHNPSVEVPLDSEASVVIVQNEQGDSHVLKVDLHECRPDQFGVRVVVSDESEASGDQRNKISLASDSSCLSFSLECLSISFLTNRPVDRLFRGGSGVSQATRLAPPADEFVRFTCNNLGLAMSATWSRGDCLQVDFEVCLDGFQLDNWAHAWTKLYDFPVVMHSAGESMAQGRLWLPTQLISLSHLVQSSPSVMLQIYPPENVIDICAENTLMHELTLMIADYQGLFSTPATSGEVVNTQQILCLRSFQISRLNVCFTLRAIMLLYISCQEAPLHLNAYTLESAGDGAVIGTSSLGHSLTMHYMKQVLFRAGWLLGSVEMLGNLTGLMNSLCAGLRDLVYLRVHKSPDRRSTVPPVDCDETVTSCDQAVPDGLLQLDLDPMDSASLASDVGTLGRLLGALNSLTRHTSGGLIRSVTSMASSIARNLDHLSLDEQHEQYRDWLRRSQTPKGLSEGLQMGLSALGLCALSAAAGIADRPLQFLFRLMEAGESSEASFVSEVADEKRKQQHTAVNLVLSVVKELGRGLLGAIVKPVAGTAEFVAQTGSGILSNSDLCYRSTTMQRKGGPYTSALNESLNGAISVDSTVLRRWSLTAMECIKKARKVTSHYDACLPKLVWMTAAVLPSETDDPSVKTVWLAADREVPYLVALQLHPSPQGFHEEITLLQPTVDCHDAIIFSSSDMFANNPTSCNFNQLVLTGQNAGQMLLSLQVPSRSVNSLASVHHCLPTLETEDEVCDEDYPISEQQQAPQDSVDAGPCQPAEKLTHQRRLSRWQRVKEYLLGTQPVDPIDV